MNYSRAGEQLSSVGHHEALKQPPALHQQCVTKGSNHFAHSGSPADKAPPNMVAAKGTFAKTAPSWQELSSRFAALVGAAMCSAC
jgi:hypothetical protein